MRHSAKIDLLGGMKATATWTDGEPEGDILFPAHEFMSYIHEHTRKDATEKASMLAGEVERWICTI